MNVYEENTRERYEERKIRNTLTTFKGIYLSNTLYYVLGLPLITKKCILILIARAIVKFFRFVLYSFYHECMELKRFFPFLREINYKVNLAITMQYELLRGMCMKIILLTFARVTDRFMLRYMYDTNLFCLRSSILYSFIEFNLFFFFN